MNSSFLDFSFHRRKEFAKKDRQVRRTIHINTQRVRRKEYCGGVDKDQNSIPLSSRIRGYWKESLGSSPIHEFQAEGKPRVEYRYGSYFPVGNENFSFSDLRTSFQHSIQMEIETASNEITLEGSKKIERSDLRYARPVMFMNFNGHINGVQGMALDRLKGKTHISFLCRTEEITDISQ